MPDFTTAADAELAAQRAIRLARDARRDGTGDNAVRDLIALAQVDATLAEVAMLRETLDYIRERDLADRKAVRERDAWRRAAFEQGEQARNLLATRIRAFVRSVVADWPADA